MESEKLVKLKKADELLGSTERPMFHVEGWWSFELCYHEKIRQFHVEDEKMTFDIAEPVVYSLLGTGGVQVYILGYHYPEEATSGYNENLSDISTLKDPQSKESSQRL